MWYIIYTIYTITWYFIYTIYCYLVYNLYHTYHYMVYNLHTIYQFGYIIPLGSTVVQILLAGGGWKYTTSHLPSPLLP